MKNKQISLLEFRAWLEGVEELQPARWTPTAPQWKLIRQKIDCIQVVTPTMVQQPLPASQYMQHQLSHPDVTVPFDQASALDVPEIPADPSNVLKHHQQPIGGIKTSGGRIVTPNIDTSHGNYNAPFA